MTENPKSAMALALEQQEYMTAMRRHFHAHPELSNREEETSRRLCQEAFPHEIGLFLGYPPEDVEGFRRNKGQNYKLCGWWKVYGDAEEAGAFFQRCDRCRAALCRQIRAGRSLPELFRAS